jgi:hypothetical protein
MGGDSLPIIEEPLAASMATEAAAAHIGNRDSDMNAAETESGIIAVGREAFCVSRQLLEKIPRVKKYVSTIGCVNLPPWYGNSIVSTTLVVLLLITTLHTTTDFCSTRD